MDSSNIQCGRVYSVVNRLMPVQTVQTQIKLLLVRIVSSRSALFSIHPAFLDASHTRKLTLDFYINQMSRQIWYGKCPKISNTLFHTGINFAYYAVS